MFSGVPLRCDHSPELRVEPALRHQRSCFWGGSALHSFHLQLHHVSQTYSAPMFPTYTLFLNKMDHHVCHEWSGVGGWRSSGQTRPPFGQKLMRFLSWWGTSRGNVYWVVLLLTFWPQTATTWRLHLLRGLPHTVQHPLTPWPRWHERPAKGHFWWPLARPMKGQLKPGTSSRFRPADWEAAPVFWGASATDGPFRDILLRDVCDIGKDVLVSVIEVK